MDMETSIMIKNIVIKSARFLLPLAFAVTLSAQVYSPSLLREGQPDPTNLKKFAEAIYVQAGAHSPREKAEAIWRFFLTDGRFVKPGYWYHIAGWTYEEPTGEVLDPVKMLNSYGFGLCYHIAPLLQAVFEAGGLDAPLLVPDGPYRHRGFLRRRLSLLRFRHDGL